MYDKLQLESLKVSFPVKKNIQLFLERDLKIIPYTHFHSENWTITNTLVYSIPGLTRMYSLQARRADIFFICEMLVMAKG